MAKKHIDVLLRKDVKSVGQAGELIKASAGYARNYLLPEGLADVATPALKEQHARKVEHNRKQAETAQRTAQAAADKLAKNVITVRVKAGQKGKLFGSVTKADIVNAAHDQLGVTLDPKVVRLGQPLKALGKHTVNLELAPNVTGTLTVQIVSAKS